MTLAGALIRVLGMGNVLMGDDGFGPAVIAALESSWKWPVEVELVDVGTPGLNLTPFLGGVDRVLLVDTAEHDGAVGAIRIFSRADVMRLPPGQRVSPHDPGLEAALFALDFAGGGPADFRLVAVRPECITTGPGLSARVRAAIPEATRAVLDVLAEWDLHPQSLATPAVETPWWLVGNS